MPNPHFSVSSLLPASKVQAADSMAYIAFRKERQCFAYPTGRMCLFHLVDRFFRVQRLHLADRLAKARRGKVPLLVVYVKHIPLLIVLPLEFVAVKVLGGYDSPGQGGEFRKSSKPLEQQLLQSS
jgi:hypothetical protein